MNLVSEGKRVQAGYWNAAGGYAFAANLLDRCSHLGRARPRAH
ncbi:hypothetical protein [Burkholderia gladioli]|nr:hypothetical protein [Burkholderia gladioli]